MLCRRSVGFWDAQQHIVLIGQTRSAEGFKAPGCLVGWAIVSPHWSASRGKTYQMAVGDSYCLDDCLRLF